MYNNLDQHHFYGKHAKYAEELSNRGYFERLVDLLAVAPIVGFEYNRKANRDSSIQLEKSMFAKQVQKVDKLLEMDYKIIMLLDTEYEPSEEKRFYKAFQVAPEARDAEDLELFESYVRGGIEFLHEKLIGIENVLDQQLIEMYDFVSSFQDRYGSSQEK